MISVDGFVVPVARANKQAFVDQAREFDSLLMQFGALRVMECWGDDVPHGKLTERYRAVQAADGETLVFVGSSGRTRPRMTRASRTSPWLRRQATDLRRLLAGGGTLT